jgi:hypothetical protein
MPGWFSFEDEGEYVDSSGNPKRPTSSLLFNISPRIKFYLALLLLTCVILYIIYHHFGGPD